MSASCSSSLQLPPGDAEIVSEEEDDGEYRHVSTLSVSGMYVSDTGFYHCHYNTTSQERNPNDVATTYVYVYGKPHCTTLSSFW